MSEEQKKELIERFISDNLPLIEDSDKVQYEFDIYWTDEQKKAFDELIKEENLNREKMEALIEKYLYEQRDPLRDEIIDTREDGQPGILQRQTIGDRILKKMKDFVETFINGIGG